jgi:hypothetical protein
MSRRDYVALATALASQQHIPPAATTGALDVSTLEAFAHGWEAARCAVTAALVVVLADDNSRFDAMRFYTAARMLP